MGMNPRNFQIRLRCFSAPFLQSADAKVQDLNYGGKIILPNSVLDTLIRYNIQYPMLFKLSNLDATFQRTTHCGVLEFLAEEGKAYLPQWMMEQLRLNEGDLCLIEYASLQRATYAKFKPTSTDFLNITNPRAMLEVELRKFACLTKGDLISVEYNEQVLQFKVMDVKPANAVTIIECDMNVEFDAPDGYVEPTPTPRTTEMPSAPPVPLPKAPSSGPFVGSGCRLDGKSTKVRTVSTSSTGSMVAGPATNGAVPMPEVPEIADVIPDENYHPGVLTFVRYDYKNRSCLEQQIREAQRDKPVPFGGNRAAGHTTQTFVAFQGQGQTMRGKR